KPPKCLFPILNDRGPVRNIESRNGAALSFSGRSNPTSLFCLDLFVEPESIRGVDPTHLSQLAQLCCKFFAAFNLQCLEIRFESLFRIASSFIGVAEQPHGKGKLRILSRRILQLLDGLGIPPGAKISQTDAVLNDV